MTRVLLADDNPDHRQSLADALANSASEIEVVTAESASRIVQELQRGGFDCVVLDYWIPPYSAPELIDLVRRTAPATPIVVVSSGRDQSIVIECMRKGLLDFVPKQDAFAGTELLMKVQEAIERSIQQRTERRRSNRRLRTLRKLANTDPLTGAYNRRYAERILNWDRHSHDRRSLTTAVMLDLDHFKALNDLHGHDAGDKALVHVTELVRCSAGSADIVVRWGGEEFLVLKPAISLEAAWMWADSLRRRLAATPVVIDGTPIEITASFGVATISSSMSPEYAMRLADRALYLAKDHGRNRVCTDTMASAMEAAERVQSERGLSVHHRAQRLLGRLKPHLGPTQIEHTGEHGRRVASLSKKLAAALHVGDDASHTLDTAALYHDIGKVGVPEAILAKPARLTRDERRLVSEHTRFGGELLRALDVGDDAAAIVEAHHRPTGAMCERSRPLPQQVLAVADAIDAMTSDRPYSAARTLPDAIRTIRGESAGHFERSVVDAAESLHAAARRAA